LEKEIPTIKAKKQADVIPCNVKWNDNRIRQITNKKPNFESKVMVPNKIKQEE
jgi:hypothetical protein